MYKKNESPLLARFLVPKKNSGERAADCSAAPSSLLSPVSVGDVSAVCGGDVVLIQPGAVVAGLVDPPPVHVVPRESGFEVVRPGLVEPRARTRVGIALAIEGSQIPVRG